MEPTITDENRYLFTAPPKMRKGPRPSSPAHRFWRRVDKAAPDKCWVWTGGTNGVGYGIMVIRRPERMVYAHRISWEMHCGPIPTGMFVCHQCDNPPCVNPSHLFLGSPRDNTRDMIEKGREVHVAVLGEDCGNSKLTSGQVAKIRALAGVKTRAELSRMFGVNPSNISHIVLRRTWKHIP